MMPATAPGGGPGGVEAPGHGPIEPDSESGTAISLDDCTSLKELISSLTGSCGVPIIVHGACSNLMAWALVG
jgi:hypothetical protein